MAGAVVLLLQQQLAAVVVGNCLPALLVVPVLSQPIQVGRSSPFKIAMEQAVLRATQGRAQDVLLPPAITGPTCLRLCTAAVVALAQRTLRELLPSTAAAAAVARQPALEERPCLAATAALLEQTEQTALSPAAAAVPRQAPLGLAVLAARS